MVDYVQMGEKKNKNVELKKNEVYLLFFFLIPGY